MMKSNLKRGTGIEVHSLLSEVCVSSPRAVFHVERHADPPRLDVGSRTGSLPCFELGQDNVQRKIVQPRQRPRSAVVHTEKPAAKLTTVSRKTVPAARKEKNDAIVSTVRRKENNVGPAMNSLTITRKEKEVSQSEVTKRNDVTSPLRNKNSLITKASTPHNKRAVKSSTSSVSAAVRETEKSEPREEEETHSKLAQDKSKEQMSVAELSKYLQDIIVSGQDLHQSSSDQVFVLPYVLPSQPCVQSVQPSAVPGKTSTSETSEKQLQKKLIAETKVEIDKDSNEW